MATRKIIKRRKLIGSRTRHTGAGGKTLKRLPTRAASSDRGTRILQGHFQDEGLYNAYPKNTDFEGTNSYMSKLTEILKKNKTKKRQTIIQAILKEAKRRGTIKKHQRDSVQESELYDTYPEILMFQSLNEHKDALNSLQQARETAIKELRKKHVDNINIDDLFPNKENFEDYNRYITDLEEIAAKKILEQSAAEAAAEAESDEIRKAYMLERAYHIKTGNKKSLKIENHTPFSRTTQKTNKSPNKEMENILHEIKIRTQQVQRYRSNIMAELEKIKGTVKGRNIEKEIETHGSTLYKNKARTDREQELKDIIKMMRYTPREI